MAAKQTLWLGDKWSIGVTIPGGFNNNRKPIGMLYLGGKASEARELTLESGELLILDQTANPGAIVFQILPETVDDTVFKGGPTATTNFNRLQVSLLDLNGEGTTQLVYPLDIRDPHVDDPATAVFTSTIVQVQGSLTIVGGGTTPGQGGTILKFPVTAVSSYNAVHGFDYQPEVWAVDQDNEPAEVDYAYTDSTHVHFTFPQPFTGTLYLA